MGSSITNLEEDQVSKIPANRRGEAAMKLMLVMTTPGKWAGTPVPVLRSPFVIGQEPGCHLRARSPTVGARHCALLVRDDRVFVSPLGDNPAFVNDQRVETEREVHNQDCLKVGCATFTVRLEQNMTAPPSARVPRTSVEAMEESAASFLLAMEEQEKRDGVTGNDGGDAKPTPKASDDGSPGTALTAKTKSTQPELPDTAAAARLLLAKFRKSRGPDLVKRIPVPH
jgi:predicted component of type VI protein secretion system